MVSKDVCYIGQSFLPSSFHFFCFVVACLFKDLSKVTGLFSYMRRIQTVENRYHHLTKLFLAIHDLHQFVKAPT
ncbi:hypothetical protein YC2023_022751 [Brassica napus]